MHGLCAILAVDGNAFEHGRRRRVAWHNPNFYTLVQMHALFFGVERPLPRGLQGNFKGDARIQHTQNTKHRCQNDSGCFFAFLQSNAPFVFTLLY